ncbi:MAG: HsdM family class I SAM-dependent methyltransferase, partial [Candidatus Hodarchaeales archaeon]
MTHNLGQKIKDLGQYYTPSSIVNFIVKNTIGSLLKLTDVNSTTEITILDPSVGQGAFLIGAKKYLEAFQSQNSQETEKFIDNSLKIVINQLYGIDIDSQQVKDSRHGLGYPKFIGNIKQFDALIPAPEVEKNNNTPSSLYSLRLRYKKAFMRKDLELARETENQILNLETKLREKTIQSLNGDRTDVFPLAWDEIFPETRGQFNVIIGNPPWGANITRIKGQISYLKSATSQMDSWSLFIERCLIGLQKNGFLGLVVPNTLLLNPNFTQIRSILLSQCTITHIINLGEGIFPGVTQPTMILIAKKTRSVPSHKISIITSTSKQTREEIMKSQVNFDTFSYLSCLQSRFEKNKNKEFDIFSLESDDFVKVLENDLYTDQKEV